MICEYLKDLTKQKVFDIVAKHLLTQMERSEDSNGYCLYKTADGLKCAAGCLISDEEYFAELDINGFNWQSLIKSKTVPESHGELIDDLQFIHDSVKPKYWKRFLKKYAEDKNLKFPEL